MLAATLRGEGAKATMSAVDAVALRRLLQVGLTVVSDLDADAVLERVLEAGREVTGARYAAVGVLDEQRCELARFLTAGVDPEARRLIGAAPSGRGVLGILIAQPRPLRLRDVGLHPLSYGVPPGHPEMSTFLGVPVLIGGEVWGNLYLTDKQGGEEFTEADQEAAVILAEWAGVAVEKARAYERSEHHRDEYERAVLELQATRDVALAAGDATGLERVLELVAKRGRALIDAQSTLVMLRDDSELVVAASSGYAEPPRGRRVPVSGCFWGEVIETRSPLRIGETASPVHLTPGDSVFPSVRTALLVPMLYLGAALGVLAAFDRGIERAPFTDADEKLLQNFAATGANAVAIAKSLDPDRPHPSPAPRDNGQQKPAHVLVEETLQILDGVRETFSTALRHSDRDHYEATIREANETIARALRSLRSAAVMTKDAP
jgi:two-component system, NarL family, sensor histidine kinase DevS